MAICYYGTRATEHTILHATIASFEYRARRQTVLRECYCILARICYSKGKMGGWRDGERARVKILEEIACSRNIRLESSAILCNCCTRHTRLPGRESARRVEAGWCKDSKSKHSHIKGGCSFTSYFYIRYLRYLVKRLGRSILTHESFCTPCFENP